MHFFLLTLLLVMSERSLAESAINDQFHGSPSEGIRVYNDNLRPVTIYSRFLLPGLDQKALRNTGTKYTLKPGSDITYYLPAGTDVIATDGVYWDNPTPSSPEERHLVKVSSGSITKLSAQGFVFRD